MTTGARTGPASFETAGPLPFQPGPAAFVFGRATRSSLERRACESDWTSRPAERFENYARPLAWSRITCCSRQRKGELNRRGRALRRGLGAAFDREQPPVARNTVEHVLAVILEPQPGSGDQILHGA